MTPIQEIVLGTIAVMTSHPDNLNKWKTFVEETLQMMSSKGEDWETEVDFFNAVLQILSNETPNLPPDHVYDAEVKEIQQCIAAFKN